MKALSRLELDPRHGLPSASSMYRLKECPGSLALTNWIKRNGYFVPRNPWALAGTRIHQWLALEILGNDPKRMEALEVELGAEGLETARKCAELRESLIRQWENDLNHDFATPVECRLWYRAGDILRFSGQPDLVRLNRMSRRALIVNYKSGRLEAAPAADNMQLRTEIVLLKSCVPDLEEIQAAIVEPLVSWDSERVSYSGQSFRQAEEEILTIVDEAAMHPERRVSGPWCAECPGRVYCKEAMHYAEKIPNFPAVGRDKLDGDGESIATIDQEKMFRDLPRGELGSAMWVRIKFAEKFLDAIVQTYERILLDDPEALPGFILPAEGKQRRRIPDPAKLKAALANIMSAEEVDGCADYSLAQIERHYQLKFGRTEAHAKAYIGELTKDVVTITHDRPFIRPLTKKEKERKALIAK